MNECRIDDQVKMNGVPSVCLENRDVRVVVLTGKGTDILEFWDKASGTDLLFKTPWGVKNPQTHVHDTFDPSSPFMDLYPGGWQELFPNAGSPCVYKGAELGFHGEVCKVPWESAVLEKSSRRVAVKLWVRTVRTPFLLEKTLQLTAEQPGLEIEETVTNEGSEPLDFMWGHHPAFGAPFLDEHCRLFAPACAVETAHALPALQRLWPPTAHFAHLSYLTELKDGWYCLVNERTRLGFALRWDVEVFRYLWLWQEFCGTPRYPWWGQGYVTGIEPHSSIPGLGLLKAIERGTQLTLPAGGSLSTRLVASVFRAKAEPKGVTEEGQVAY
jgi:Domain of unknown function (DUF4432)